MSGTGKALFDFAGADEGELPFSSGDRITNVRKLNDDWYEGQCKGQTGMFPANYIGLSAPLAPAPVASKPPLKPKGVVEKPVMKGFRPPSSLPASASPKRSSAPTSGPRVRALLAYTATSDDELSLADDEVVRLIRHVDDDFVEVECGGKRGKVSGLYIDIIEDVSAGKGSSLATIQDSDDDDLADDLDEDDAFRQLSQKKVPKLPEGYTPGALYDRRAIMMCRASKKYTAREGRELSVSIDDSVEVLKMCDHDWMEGRLNGRVGAVPFACLEVVNTPIPEPPEDMERKQREEEARKRRQEEVARKAREDAAEAVAALQQSAEAAATPRAAVRKPHAATSPAVESNSLNDSAASATATAAVAPPPVKKKSGPPPPTRTTPIRKPSLTGPDAPTSNTKGAPPTKKAVIAPPPTAEKAPKSAALARAQANRKREEEEEAAAEVERIAAEKKKAEEAAERKRRADEAEKKRKEEKERAQKEKEEREAEEKRKREAEAEEERQRKKEEERKRNEEERERKEKEAAEEEERRKKKEEMEEEEKKRKEEQEAAAAAEKEKKKSEGTKKGPSNALRAKMAALAATSPMFAAGAPPGVTPAAAPVQDEPAPPPVPPPDDAPPPTPAKDIHYHEPQDALSQDDQVYDMPQGDSGVQRGVAIADFVAREDIELSFSEGQEMNLLERIDDDWYNAELDGRTGQVPASYVDVIPTQVWAAARASTSNAARSPTGKRSSTGEARTPSTDVAGGGSGGGTPTSAMMMLMQAVQLEDESAMGASSDSISSGTAPAPAPPPASGKPQLVNLPKPDVAVAAADWTARSDEELTFEMGARMDIVERVDEHWLECEMENGTRGLVPVSYVDIEPAPAPPLAIAGVQPATTAPAARRGAPRGRGRGGPRGGGRGGRGGGAARGGARSSGSTGGSVRVRTARATTLFPFEAEHDDELSFGPNETLRVIAQLDEAWYSVVGPGGAKRIVPVNYIKLEEPLPAQQQQQPAARQLSSSADSAKSALLAAAHPAGETPAAANAKAALLGALPAPATAPSKAPRKRTSLFKR